MLFLPSPPPAPSAPLPEVQGLFFDVYCENLVKLQEVKLCPFPDGSPGVVNSALSTPPAICELQFRFFCLALVPVMVYACEYLPGES